MDGMVHIGAAARALSVTPEHLRSLEREGRVPQPSRDLNGRVYSAADLELLRALGVGSRPARLKELGEVLEA